MIKFWALIYRLTGWYSPLARVVEYKALKDWLHTDSALLTTKELGPSGAAGLFIGSWQADHGFCRKFTFKKKLRRRGKTR